MKKLAALVMLIVTLFSLFPTAHAATVVTPTDLSGTDITAEGVFIPAEYIPSFATVPEFYIKIENVNSLYMFIDKQGNAHKRRYGSIDGVYGWYETVGTTFDVADGSFPVNVEKDREIADVIKVTVSSTDYVGILPPEVPVSEVKTMFGVNIMTFMTWALVIILALCVLIVVLGVTVVRKRSTMVRYRR